MVIEARSAADNAFKLSRFQLPFSRPFLSKKGHKIKGDNEYVSKNTLSLFTTARTRPLNSLTRKIPVTTKPLTRVRCSQGCYRLSDTAIAKTLFKYPSKYKI